MFSLYGNKTQHKMQLMDFFILLACFHNTLEMMQMPFWFLFLLNKMRKEKLEIDNKSNKIITVNGFSIVLNV